jgi:hypothetical protein
MPAVETIFSRSTCAEIDKTEMAKIMNTEGNTTTNSAVTAPLSLLARCIAGKGECASHQVKKYLFDLFASHDYHKQPREPNGSHRGNRILGGCRSGFIGKPILRV